MAEEAIDVNPVVEEITTPAEPSTAETNIFSSEDDFDLDFGDAPEDTKSDAEEPAIEEDKPTEEAPEEKEETPEEQTPEPTGAEKRKQQLNTEIRDLVAERNALRAEIAEANKQKYEIKTEVPSADDLITKVNPETGDYYSRVEAELAQLKAERALEKEQAELDKYTETIVENNMRLKEESERVLRDYPMFDENSEEYNKEIAERADKILASALSHDPRTGKITNCAISPYELYSTIANAVSAAKQAGEAQARKSVQKMVASTEVDTTSVTPTRKNDYDPFIDGLLS